MILCTCSFAPINDVNYLNKINTKIDDLNIKIRLKNEISFRCINTIDFLILSLELVVSPPKKKKV